MPLCFAYSSNLIAEAMAARCPGAKPLGPARLVRHRFLVNADGIATVVRDARGTVWGLLWDVPLSDMPALDRDEGVAAGLHRKLVQPVLTTAGPRRALVHVGRSAEPGSPGPGYLEPVIAAAWTVGVPPAYLRELEAWLPAARSESVRPERLIRSAPSLRRRLTPL